MSAPDPEKPASGAGEQPAKPSAEAPVPSGTPSPNGKGASEPKPAAIRPKVVRAGFPPPATGAKKPILVLPAFRKRDVVLTIVIVVVVVGLIALCIYKMGTDVSPNVLTGMVIEKNEATVELGVSSKGVSTVDSGYHLRVQVGDRKYLITTLPKEEWDRYQVGDSIKFMKPLYEQR